MIKFTPAEVHAYLDQNEIPWSVACAITHELVCDPVHARGTPEQVYEDHALRSWLRHNAHDPRHPATGALVSPRDIAPSPKVRGAANALRRFASQECRRRAALPGLTAEVAEDYRRKGAILTIARHRYAHSLHQRQGRGRTRTMGATDGAFSHTTSLLDDASFRADYVRVASRAVRMYIMRRLETDIMREFQNEPRQQYPWR